MRASSALSGLALSTLVACQADILGGDVSKGAPPSIALPGGGSAGQSTGGAATTPAGLSAGAQPLRRMTVVEYENTVRDLLGPAAPFASGLPTDSRGDSGFPLAGSVGEVDADKLGSAADRLAADAVSKGLPTLMGCNPDGGNETSCLHQFVQAFGRRAFRRALTDKET